MNHLEELLARSIDEKLTQQEQQELDQALYQSTDLMRNQAELALIIDMAAKEPPPCPPGVFLRLQEQVDQQYARKSRPWYFLPISKPALGIALTLALIMAFLVIRQPAPNLEESLSIEKLKMDVAMAQQQYHQAIGNMELVAIKQLENMSPQLAIVYAHNLNELNRAIGQCEALLDNSHDLLIYQNLNRAYTAKVDLLESILGS